MRRCVGCMESKPKSELIRITEKNGLPVPDPTGKDNGRGVYLCNDEACFEKAKKRKSITRGLNIQGFSVEDMETLRTLLREISRDNQDKREWQE
ncbi:MAG: YlxR family protein [Clostridiales Family XIII bacterium]|jgi:predicted RNA-binding protein YlxR (DUF448 family)|nr:YlxR family protein [Clostridiales Family XIII bacterium]